MYCAWPIVSLLRPRQSWLNSNGLYEADTRKIVVIPPGVDVSRFYPISKDEAKEVIGVPPCEDMLLFVGRIEPLKGIDTLIHAIAQLCASKVCMFVCQ